MSFTSKPSVELSLDQVIGLVEQLSDKDAEKVMQRLELKRKTKALARMRTIWGKVKMSEKEITKIVEEVRQERYERQKARAAGR